MAGTTGLEPATSAVTETRNSLEPGVANGHFQRPEEPLATLIGPLMDPRPLPCRPLPISINYTAEHPKLTGRFPLFAVFLSLLLREEIYA